MTLEPEPDPVAEAERLCRATGRRRRQLLEIAALVAGGHRRRASGLALLHVAEFPADADALASVVEVTGP